MADHVLRDGHVDVGPDGLGHCNVVAKLRLTEYAVLVGLVVARPQDCPMVCCRVVRALHNRIVLNAVACLVHGHALLQLQSNDVRVGLARHSGLERRWSTVAGLGDALKVGRHRRWRVLARQCLAGVQNVGAAIARDVQRTLEHVRLEHRVVALARLVAEQEVNAVLISRLPLVDAEPRVSAAVLHGRHGGGLGCEDQTVRRVAELGVQQGVDGLLHHRPVACEEDLGLDTQRLLTRCSQEVSAQVLDELAGTAKTARGCQVLVRQHQRQPGRVLASEGVDVEDAEQIQIR